MLDHQMRLAVIADDLTGAADTGIQFAKRNFHTILLPFGLKDAEMKCHLHEAQVVALNTDTRAARAEQAYNKVRDSALMLMRELHPQNIYKKIDSTLRGNVGAEVEAAMDATGTEPAILAPAFPDCNRTTVGGVHLVNGQPLSQTEAAFDPISPVSESHVPTLTRAQTRLKVGHIGLEEVQHGPISLQRSILRCIKDGEKIIIFDAVTNDDLRNIAEAGMSMASPPLMVGSAGLADQVSRYLERTEPPKSPPTTRYLGIHHRVPQGVIIIISGSLSAVTSRQLNEVRTTGRGKIIPSLVNDQESEIVSEIISATETSRVIGVQSVRERCHDGQNVEAQHTIPPLIVGHLGRIALQVVRDCPQSIRGLILIGGDTALAVFKHLGFSQVRLVDEILPGIPYGQVVAGEFAGLTVVTKAGAFGDESALVNCIDFLEM